MMQADPGHTHTDPEGVYACSHRAPTQEKSHSSDTLIMILTLAKLKISLLPPMGKREHTTKVKKETKQSSS